MVYFLLWCHSNSIIIRRVGNYQAQKAVEILQVSDEQRQTPRQL
jgi:hypothetical protein